MSLNEFENNLWEKYMSERYCDNKIKKFHQLKLGKLNADEYTNKILELLTYVPYIKDEKVNI